MILILVVTRKGDSKIMRKLIFILIPIIALIIGGGMALNPSDIIQPRATPVSMITTQGISPESAKQIVLEPLDKFRTNEMDSLGHYNTAPEQIVQGVSGETSSRDTEVNAPVSTGIESLENFSEVKPFEVGNQTTVQSYQDLFKNESLNESIYDNSSSEFYLDVEDDFALAGSLFD